MPTFSARARALVRERLPAGLTVGALAEALGVDRTTLFRRLRAEGDTTPSVLIRAVRLEHAADLLASGARIWEAAEAAGYAEATVFRRAFVRHFGCPPTTWREDEECPDDDGAPDV